MATDYVHPVFPFHPPPELATGEDGRTTVAVVGAGPVGLTLAIDLAQRGVAVTLLDDDDTVSHGSRLICLSKRTLEIFDRLGVGQPFRDKGVVWNRGRLFFRDREIYDFDLLPEPGHAWPAFINIQQYYVEDFLVRAADATEGLDIRWKNAVTGVEAGPDGATLAVETPDGAYRLKADYVVACDGARSTVRHALDLPFVGRAFRDQFLIADVAMESDFPSERWFWFEPPFHDGQSALLHKQPDGVWRIDLQLEAGADPDVETREENVRPRIQRMLGPDARFEIKWISLYTFRCRRLARFRHGRVFFAGDSAHQVSPFGARGGNGGVQDADNLAWKLAAVLKGEAPAALLESYEAERIPAADENIRNSTRSTDFMTPKSAAVRDVRDAVLALAKDHAFARRMVNSGRLSVPAVLDSSPLNTADAGAFGAGAARPGAAALDAGLAKGHWLLNELGPGFTLLVYAEQPSDLPEAWPETPDFGAGLKRLVVAPNAAAADAEALIDAEGLVADRYDLSPGAAYLFRPDQHVAARARHPDTAWLKDARRRATGEAAP